MPRTAVPTENVNEVNIEEIVKIQEQIQIFVPPLGLSWLNVMQYGSTTFWTCKCFLSAFY